MFTSPKCTTSSIKDFGHFLPSTSDFIIFQNFEDFPDNFKSCLPNFRWYSTFIIGNLCFWLWKIILFCCRFLTFHYWWMSKFFMSICEINVESSAFFGKIFDFLWLWIILSFKPATYFKWVILLKMEKLFFPFQS